MKILLPSVYLGNITYYGLLKRGDAAIELHEHFVKQTYRNRCTVYGANGKLDLIVPVEKSKGSQRKIMKDCRISYNDNWQKIHWRSLESAYRTSPYFEYYEDDLKPFYEKKVDFVVDWNEMLQQKMCELLQLELKWNFTEKYEENYPDTADYRNDFDPNKTLQLSTHQPLASLPYTQVFENKHGFIPDLSIADLLFNTGPEAAGYL